MTARPTPASIDEYIASFTPELQATLQKIRLTIKEEARGAEERISYQMPAFSLSGDLIYFAAFKKHIGLYPPVKGDDKLNAELSPYRGEKGNLKFPLDEPIPYALIRRVVQCRLREHLEKSTSRRTET